MTTIAHHLTSMLKANNVKRVYGVAGDFLNGQTDAIRIDGSMRWAPLLHGEGDAFTACAEAELTGKPAV
ncbi:thiamine pyrophosphate-binding protein [Paeniglutamicibacter cryotolerans]|uniref:Thiamine pyrophosphate-dependent acetolactate synthase large subunit-like protein n=1 Tax=Paeniglutamicibacter cryotolerans TaxID=670079 RepID=A0A839QQG1_9MICC|nr:thiamine pyrophosphate-binding protein [Paeniglutamicibacter cryotolerans]MBB2997004.1 thiamine pyrophosphate-dependent acetolactate synthase large subunit-like protein [Paeniglutamicibacter cryotolerans]